MSVKINVPFLIVFLFICFKGVVGKNCGNLSYSQPAFNGGNVTITYKPIKFSATEKPIIFNSDGNTWIPVPSTIMSNPVLGVFTTVFKTNILITVYLHAKYGPCYNKPSVILSVKDEVWLNAHDTTSVTCTAKSQPLSDIVWSVNGNTQLLVCNKSIECEIHTLPIETDEHRNHTCTAFFEFGDYDTSATISFLAIGRASTQKTYETPNKSKDASLTNSNDIPMVWIVIGLSVIIAVVIISPVIVLARKLSLSNMGNELVDLNEEVTYAQVNKVRTQRTETVGPKTKGSDTNLIYADIDIKHLETASKPPSRKRPPSPTEYADVHTIRTERGSNSDNIIT
ncbi:hypothetical protein MAR_030703 [Mya arenaria]|uniref:Ig-like domain-containing protein n=1 Tax=Mya arenaria TaxID=6604 RepID=A0ABY7F3Z7_MYAAR|nr:hypothetical protein MAR_030703 [Mya arenaria]